jgi:hypothetical protein
VTNTRPLVGASSARSCRWRSRWDRSRATTNAGKGTVASEASVLSESVTDRDRRRYGFEAEGLAIEAGGRPAGYENGDVGWSVSTNLGGGAETDATCVQ